MKKILLIIGSIVVLIVVAGVIAFKQIENNLEVLANTEIEDIDLSSVEDGTYLGEYSSFPVSVNVTVTILNHEIIEVEITKHIQGQGLSAEAIVDDVIEEQSLAVDAIAGATYSSKVILLAIRDALTEAEGD